MRRPLTDDELADAARRLKQRTGAGLQRQNVSNSLADRMLAKEMAQAVEAAMYGMSAYMARAEYDAEYGHYVDMVQVNGVWMTPEDAREQIYDERHD